MTCDLATTPITGMRVEALVEEDLYQALFSALQVAGCGVHTRHGLLFDQVPAPG